MGKTAMTDRDNSSKIAILQTKLEAQSSLLHQVKKQLADALEQRDKWQHLAEAQWQLLETKRVERTHELVPAIASADGFCKAFLGKRPHVRGNS